MEEGQQETGQGEVAESSKGRDKYTVTEMLKQFPRKLMTAPLQGDEMTVIFTRWTTEAMIFRWSTGITRSASIKRKQTQSER